ncbi:MAG: hypothetical protein WCR52_14010 [Bacteroidota bacterium]
MTKIRILISSAFLMVFLAQCNKETIIPVVEAPKPFVLTVDNSYNELQAKIGVFISDADGVLKAFRWVDGEDTAQIRVPGNTVGNRYDCTIAKVVALDASGSGVRDTSITLTTYTNVKSGETIYMRAHNYTQVTDLRIQFTNIASFDSIIVSDGISFSRPQAANNFYGQYRVTHTGKFWARIMINGEANWRYMLFENINSPDVVATIDATLLPKIMAKPKAIQLPFVTPWKYNVQGVVDLNANQFFPLGDLSRAPGGATPAFNELSVYEPIMNDVFDPGPKPYNGFRVQVSGSGADPDAYIYQSDRIYPELPDALTVPTFSVVPSPSSTNRFSGVNCTGQFDLLSVTRSNTGSPSFSWEVLLAPPANGISSYRLPELPKELSNLSFALSQYSFGGIVHAQGEAYDQYLGFEPVMRKRMLNDDPLWQARAGFVAKGK